MNIQIAKKLEKSLRTLYGSYTVLFLRRRGGNKQYNESTFPFNGCGRRTKRNVFLILSKLKDTQPQQQPAIDYI